jgi:hypothetical protein
LGLSEAFAKEDGELGFRHGLLTWWHDPFLLGAVQDEKQQLHGCLVGGEVAAGPNRPA